MSGPFFEASSMDGGNHTMMMRREIEERGREGEKGRYRYVFRGMGRAGRG